METYRVWVGKRNFVGKGEFNVIEFIGEKVGVEADVFAGGMSGVNFHVFITENNRVLIYQHDWSNRIDDESEASIVEFADFDEAANSGYWSILMDMKVTFRAAHTLDAWRAAQRQKMN
jgi:hypothetical protein